MKLNNLKTKYLGRNCIYYKTIDSTQSEIWRLTKKSVQNGTLVMADIQTQGKGTHGRVWHTDKENNIAFSFYVQMDCNIKKLDGLTLKIAQLIVEIMKDLYKIHLEIKIPNDIVYHNKKLGGILTQTTLTGENVKELVIGIGINTSQEVFDDEISEIATSIKKEFQVDVNVAEFISEFCNRFEEELEKIK